jgi:hypothetical protein
LNVTGADDHTMSRQPDFSPFRRPATIALLAVVVSGVFWSLRVQEVRRPNCCVLGEGYFLAVRAGTPMTSVLDQTSLGDGHLYRVLASDPLLQRDDILRVPTEQAYRSQRMLVPWLIWATTLGNGRGFEVAQLVWLFVGIAASAWALADVLQQRRRAPMFALLVAFIPGVVATLHFAGVDTVAAAAVALAIRSHAQGSLRQRAGWLSAAVLARESSILVAIAMIVEQCLTARSLRPLWTSSVAPFVVLAVWQLVLRWRFGQWAILGGLDGNRGRMWSGLGDGITLWGQRSVTSAILIAVAMAVPFALRSPIWVRVLVVLTAVASSSFGVLVWGDYLGFPRPFIPVCLAAIVARSLVTPFGPTQEHLYASDKVGACPTRSSSGVPASTT